MTCSRTSPRSTTSITTISHADPANTPAATAYDSEFGDIDTTATWISSSAIYRTAHPAVGRSEPALHQSGISNYDFVNRRFEYGIVYDEGDLKPPLGTSTTDMDLDLVIGGVYQAHYTRLYRNDGDHFTDVTYETGAQIHQSGTVGWSDVNEDGALDIKLHGSDSPQLHLFINRIGLKNNWVEFTLQGKTSNRDGIGARVTLKAGGVTQMRDVRGSSGGGISANQNSRIVHFWIGAEQDDRSIDGALGGRQDRNVHRPAMNGLSRRRRRGHRGQDPLA